jgi:glycosyltransferase involved in cell wall biosynthesis
MGNKILLLSWGVPPAVTGAATVVANLAQQFRREDMIVAGEKPHNPPPFSWSNDWPELVYVRYVWPFGWRGYHRWRIIQWPYLFCRCLWLVRRHQIDSIVVVFPDTHFLLAGYLSARLLRRRLFPYFHNTYLENRQGLRRLFARWLQARVFAYAEHVFVMSDGMSELYRERYPQVRKQSPLLHSFSETLPRLDVPPTVGSPMRIAVCGNINATCDEAATRLGEAIATCPDTRLSVYGGTTAHHLRAIGLLREGGECGAVSREELLRRLAGADVLVLPHGFTGSMSAEEYQTIFPTKTIEYLMSGRPILAHTPPGCFLTRFLRENDCALIVDRPDVDALREALERLRTDFSLRSRLAANARRTAERFRAPRVAAEFRRVLGLPVGAKD